MIQSQIDLEMHSTPAQQNSFPVYGPNLEDHWQSTHKLVVDAGPNDAADSPSAYSTPPETPDECSPLILPPTFDPSNLLQAEKNVALGALDLRHQLNIRGLPRPPLPEVTTSPFNPLTSPAIRNSPPVHTILFQPHSSPVQKAPVIPGLSLLKPVYPSMSSADRTLITNCGEDAKATYESLRQVSVEVSSIITRIMLEVLLIYAFNPSEAPQGPPSFSKCIRGGVHLSY